MDTNLMQKIRKLYDLATDGGATEAEAANALAQAEKLARKAGVALAEAVQAGQTEGHKIKGGEARADGPSKAAMMAGRQWRQRIADTIAQGMGGKAYTLANKYGQPAVVFFGAEDLLPAMVESYRFIEVQAELACRKGMAKRERYPKDYFYAHKAGKFVEKPNQYKDGFLGAYADRVTMRLLQARRNDETTSLPYSTIG
jgi:hypothetical protein